MIGSPSTLACAGIISRRPARSSTACPSSIPNGANPGAGGRPGRLAFAGDQWGAASFGARYPEDDWYGGFAPRLGAVYSLNDRTVIRSGYGIFYTQAFYPGWGGGISQDGFSNNAIVRATLGGIAPAMLLDQGFPQSSFEAPPIIRSDYRNGQGILYRPVDANERPYSHQWNVTVERELLKDLSLSVGYVGTAGRRLPSSVAPINAIDPQYLSMGSALYDQFQPGMPSLHGVPLPYAGLGRTDDRLRAFGRAGAPALSAGPAASCAG